MRSHAERGGLDIVEVFSFFPTLPNRVSGFGEAVPEAAGDGVSTGEMRELESRSENRPEVLV